ncbi:MAG: AraC family transcriptional regulator [Chitinophagaceae bacterium]|nr:MAG: AraC family transcriptional regulator [Chitinophagaceae bacterium]
MAGIYIKNMVCNRCKTAVRAEFEKLGILPESVELGEVSIAHELSSQQKELLGSALENLGFELIDDRKSRVISKIKTLIIDLIQKKDGDLKVNLSAYLSSELHQDYNTLSALFSDVEGTTIEQFFIAQKIERVKELLVYDELSLTEIAYQLNYSSVAHLSNQFKKVTGLTPTHFKTIGSAKRKPLDEV